MTQSPTRLNFPPFPSQKPVFRGFQLFHSTERFIGMDFIDLPIEFAALARSLGIRARRIDTSDEFGAAYRDALAARERVLLEVIVDGSV
jgi:thiamine pyrophosphate-dependent acetolactate synthase large subunit-like protein